MKVKVTLCFVASLLLSYTEAQGLPGKWPALDVPPPINAEWTALVDQTKVANAPIQKTAGGSCPAKDTFCNWSCTGCTRNASDIVECPSQSDWGISYDDGPTIFTPKLLDYYDTIPNSKATFFVIGSRVVENPTILQRAVKAGHQIGAHTWSHPALTTQSNEQIIAEFKWTEQAIMAAVGFKPKYMRPPFGDFDDRVRDIATQLGYKIVIWNEDTNDWMSGTDKSFQLSWIEGNFTEWVKQPSQTGHISLEHDLYQQTVANAIESLPIVMNAGFTVKTVAQCNGDLQPYDYGTSKGTTAYPSTDSSSSYPSTDSSSSYPSTDSSTAAAAPSSSGSSYGSGASSYGSGTSYLTGNSTSNSTSNSTMSSDASLNTINLWSFASLIAGAFMFI